MIRIVTRNVRSLIVRLMLTAATLMLINIEAHPAVMQAQPQQLPFSCGGAWKTVFQRNLGGRIWLLDIAATPDGGAWAVGYTDRTGAGLQPLIVGWDGTSLNYAAVENLYDPIEKGGGYLSSVIATGPDEAWAAGWATDRDNAPKAALIMRWDGVAWSRIAPNGPLAAVKYVADIARVSNGDLIGVGVTDGQSQFIRYSGGVWSVSTIANAVNLQDIAAVAPNDIWAVGWEGVGVARPVIYRYNGVSWARMSTPDLEATLEGIAVSPTGQVWISGNEAPYKPLVLRWDGANLTKMTIPTLNSNSRGAQNLPGVVAFADDNVWVAGSVVLHWDGAQWRQLALTKDPLADTRLRGLAGFPGGKVLAVGSDQILSHQPTLSIGGAQFRTQGAERFADVPVSLTASTPHTVTVQAQTVAQSALPGRDYEAVTTTLTFPPCSTTPQIVEVPLITGQPTRMLQVALSVPTSAAVAGPGTTSVATLSAISKAFLPAIVRQISQPQVAFVMVEGERWEIYVANADLTNRRRLTFTDTQEMSPDWSPDGTQLLYTTLSRDGRGDIYVMNADGSSQRPIHLHPAGEGSPKWAPDGRRIAFVSDRTDFPRIYVMNADGSNIRPITVGIGPGFPRRRDLEPTWSPDGTQIAFVMEAGADSGLYVINADGSNLRRLTQSTALSPAWSPNGEWIAFRAALTPIRDCVCLIRPDGTDLRDLNANFDLTGTPSWSADSRSILLMVYTSLAIASVDDQTLQILYTPQSFGISTPDWAPR